MTVDEPLLAARYQLGERVNNQQMLEVDYYAAIDTHQRQPVTIRVINIAQKGNVGQGIEHLAADKLRRKMETEKRILDRLTIPGVLTLLEHGFDDPFYYHVYPAFVFQNLQMLIDREGKLSSKDVLSYFRQLVTIITALHEMDIIHGDISANNILILDGETKLIEFTIANHEQLDGAVSGDMFYMSPEAIMGMKPAPPRDVWALGVTLTYALQGKFPFGHTDAGGADSVPHLFQKILNAPPLLLTDIPSELSQLLMQMLDKDPSKRISLPQINTRLALWDEWSATG